MGHRILPPYLWHGLHQRRGHLQGHRACQRKHGTVSSARCSLRPSHGAGTPQLLCSGPSKGITFSPVIFSWVIYTFHCQRVLLLLFYLQIYIRFDDLDHISRSQVCQKHTLEIVLFFVLFCFVFLSFVQCSRNVVYALIFRRLCYACILFR